MESNLPNNRRIVIIGIILLISVIYIVKLFTLQVVDNQYKTSASSNVLRYVTQYPVRGLIYDRNKQLLAYNEAAYDLMVIPKQLDVFDTTDFCNILDIDKEFLSKSLNEAKAYSRYKPSVLIKQISVKTYAVLQEQMYKFPGFLRKQEL
jgi:penicillin-binding protein 2